MGANFFIPPIAGGLITGDVPLRQIWAWNGVDTTQFGTRFTSGPAHVGVLDVIAMPVGISGNPNRNILRFGFNGTAAAVYFPINDLPTMPDRFLIEFISGPRQSGALGAGIAGMTTYQDATHLFRHELNTPTGNGSILVANNVNGYSAGAGSPTTTCLNYQAGQIFRVYCDIKDPSVGVDPEAYFRHETFGGTSLAALPTRNIVWGTFGGGTGIDTGWDPTWQTAVSIKGVAAHFVDVGAGVGYIADMKIYAWGD